MSVRFDQDSFELHHHVDESAAVQTSLVFKSTPGLTLADLAAVENVIALTSLLYPLEVIERFDVSSDPLPSSETASTGNIDVGTDIVDAALDTTIAYREIRVEVHQIDVTTNLLSGAIDTTIAYREIRAEIEQFNVSSNLLSGNLTVTVNYVTHYDPASDETFNVSSNLISGILT